jgi:hypothetical protein
MLTSSPFPDRSGTLGFALAMIGTCPLAAA